MAEKNPDLNFELGYDLKTQKVQFGLKISNIFDRLGKKRFGFSASKWWTKRKGKLDAKQLIPESHATVPDGREQDIDLQRDDELKKLKGHVEQLTHDAKDWIERHKPNRLNAQTLAKEIKAKLHEELSEYRRPFQETRTEFNDSLRQYENFRRDNGIERHAEVPLYFMKPIALLVSLLLFETLVNAAIFAGISPQGLVGGWISAVFISLVNILLGLVFGLLIIRYAVTLDQPWRYVVIGAGSLLAIFAMFFNLYVAHFREVAEAAIIADEAGLVELSRAEAPRFADAWPHFIQNIFNLGSVLGIALFVIGLCIFGYATYEGYKGFTDPIPGFGKLGKRFFINRLYRMGLEQEARDTAYNVLDVAKSNIETATALHFHFQQQVSSAISFTQRLAKVATTAEERVNNHAWALISDYRSANKRKRLKMKRKAERKPDKSLPNPGNPPAYFDVDLRKSGAWETVVPEVIELERLAQNAHAAISDNLKVLDEARQLISDFRLGVDGQLRDALDEEDIVLNEQIRSMDTSKKGKLKVVNEQVA